jgi:hypothetical protein
LPVPVSPCTSTIVGWGATFSTRASTSRITGLSPMMPESPAADVRRYAFSAASRSFARRSSSTSRSFSRVSWKSSIARVSAARISSSSHGFAR